MIVRDVFFRTPELASTVTLQPIKRFPLDAAIIFSDILVLLQAMGMEVKMVPEVGPTITHPIKTPKDLSMLKKDVDVTAELKYVADAIHMTRHKLNGSVPLIGFAGAPWTLMCYMVQGGGSKTFSRAKKWLYSYPRESMQLLSTIAEHTTEYLFNQIKAGAQMVQLFESHMGFLTPQIFAASK